MVTSNWELHQLQVTLPIFASRGSVSMLLSSVGAAAAATWCRSGDDSLKSLRREQN